jgi:hypothetical protein
MRVEVIAEKARNPDLRGPALLEAVLLQKATAIAGD